VELDFHHKIELKKWRSFWVVRLQIYIHKLKPKEQQYILLIKENKRMNIDKQDYKDIIVPITEGDIRLFEELIDNNRELIDWTFDGVNIRFIKERRSE